MNETMLWYGGDLDRLEEREFRHALSEYRVIRYAVASMIRSVRDTHNPGTLAALHSALEYRTRVWKRVVLWKPTTTTIGVEL